MMQTNLLDCKVSYLVAGKTFSGRVVAVFTKGDTLLLTIDTFGEEKINLVTKDAKECYLEC